MVQRVRQTDSLRAKVDGIVSRTGEGGEEDSRNQDIICDILKRLSAAGLICSEKIVFPLDCLYVC